MNPSSSLGLSFYESLILKSESSWWRSVPIIFSVDLPILFDCFFINFCICLLFYCFGASSLFCLIVSNSIIFMIRPLTANNVIQNF
jgi:hypothetical protein